MVKLGLESIRNLYYDGSKIKKAYLGDYLIFSSVQTKTVSWRTDKTISYDQNYINAPFNLMHEIEGTHLVSIKIGDYPIIYLDKKQDIASYTINLGQPLYMALGYIYEDITAYTEITLTYKTDK